VWSEVRRRVMCHLVSDAAFGSGLITFVAAGRIAVQRLSAFFQYNPCDIAGVALRARESEARPINQSFYE